MSAPPADVPAMTDAQLPTEDPIVATRLWLERIVIGLNLCPFAKAVYVKDQVRIVLSDATTTEALVEQLAEELVLLRDTPAEQIDTTLIVHPQVLTDFLDYNDFLDNADAAIEALDLQGILQVASFHPDYQFEGVAPGDASNYTNRAPFPTLHLLREDSVARAVDAFPDPDVIVERNIQTLDRIGVDGWHRRLRGEDLS
ncbi:PRELI/MSF1 domain-containing protein [Stenotrophomonas maltophilia]